MADDRSSDVLAHHKPDAGRCRLVGTPDGRPRLASDMEHDSGRTDSTAATGGLREVAARAHPVGGRQHGGGQAARRLRPLRRRADRIERPARVRIRNRNPWVLARRRVFGWKVRLLTGNAPETQVEAAAHRPAQTVGLRTPPDAGEGRQGGCAGMRQCPKIAQQPHCGRPTVRSRSTRGQTVPCQRGRRHDHGQLSSLPAPGPDPATTRRSHEAGCGQPLDGRRWKWVASRAAERPRSTARIASTSCGKPCGPATGQQKGWLARKW